MGNSSSKSKQTIKNKTINKNYLDTLNKTIMNSAVETMINNASDCSSAVNINNSCDISGAKIGGDFNFTGDQKSEAKVNFNCIQANQTSSEMAVAMMNSMMAEMNALNGSEAAADLNNASQSSNKSGFISSPSSSKSNSDTKQKNTIRNTTRTNIENIFQQNLSNNFSVETVNECIGKTIVNNSQDLSGIDVGGNANIECIQTATLEQVQNCKQLSQSISKTTQETFQELGLTVESESVTSSDTKSTVTSKSDNVSTGPIEEFGNAISNIMGALGLGFLGPILAPICSICSCIIVIVLIIVIFRALSSSGGETNSLNIPDMTLNGNTNGTSFENPSGTSNATGFVDNYGMSDMLSSS